MSYVQKNLPLYNSVYALSFVTHYKTANIEFRQLRSVNIIRSLHYTHVHFHIDFCMVLTRVQQNKSKIL